jgi:hypothetical protein
VAGATKNPEARQQVIEAITKNLIDLLAYQDANNFPAAFVALARAHGGLALLGLALDDQMETQKVAN